MAKTPQPPVFLRPRLMGVTGALLAACVVAPVDAQVALGRLGGMSLGSTGLVQADAAWYRSDFAALSGDAQRPDQVGHDWRVAILFLRGQGPGGLDWKIGYERNAAKWLDVNARYRFGADRHTYVRVGQFKQPNGMERLSSRTSRDFMSAAMMTNTFAVGNRVGVAYGREFGAGDDAAARHPPFAVTASYFGRELAASQHLPNVARGNGFALRGSWAPVDVEGRIAHLGLSYASYATRDATLRWRVHPDVELTPARLLDTGGLPGTRRVSTIGAETFWVAGPIKLQGEYMLANAFRRDSADARFQGVGGYVSGLWNLDGQTWRYVEGLPVTPVEAVTGVGMWQLGLRYDAIDLDHGAVRGGRMTTWTLGVNWYWTAHLKFALNHVRVASRRGPVTDDPSITGLRLQFHW